MRHLGSIVLALIGVVLLPALLVMGFTKVVAAGIYGGQPLDHNLLAAGLVLLALAGVVYAALMVMRLSPLGLFVAGLLLATGSLIVMDERQRVLSYLPSRLLGQTDVQWLAPAPYVFVLSIPLLLSIFSTWRWRRRGRTEKVVERVEATEPMPVGGYGESEQESWRSV